MDRRMDRRMDGWMNNKQHQFISVSKYRKIPIISPGLIFVQKAFLLGLFSGELIFGRACYRKEFCVSKWVGLNNKNSLKHYENSLKQLTLTVRGLIFERAYYRKDFCIWDLGDLFSGGLIFGGAYYRNFTVFNITAKWGHLHAHLFPIKN